MVAMTALKKMGPYRGQVYVAGDAFEAQDESDATLLSMLKMAKRDRVTVEPDPENEPVEPSAPLVLTDDEIAALDMPLADAPSEAIVSDEPEADDPPVSRRRRSYNRRNMTAEE